MKENKKVLLNRIDMNAITPLPLYIEALQGPSNSVLCVVLLPQSAQLH